MVDNSSENNIAGRLERLPQSTFHLKFAMMLASGEWAESLMLLGNGAILGLVAATYGLSGNLSAYYFPGFFFVGEFLGSIFFGRLADAKGRKAVFLINQLLFGVGMIIAGFMNSWQLIGIFVMIGGIGVGGEFPLVDSYGTEIFVKKNRGAWLAFIYTIAVTSAPIIVYMTSITAGMGYYSFRIPLWFMGIVGICVWLIRFKLMESPRWLETHGHLDEAKKLMDKIETEVKRETKKELPPIRDVTAPVVKNPRWIEMFAPDVRKTTILMAIFMFFQSGVFYGFVIFAPGLLVVKYPSNDPLGIAAVIFSGFLIGSVFNIFIMDKIERRTGIIIFMALGGIFGTMFSIASGLNESIIFGFLTSFMLWNFSNFYHQYNAEIFPTRLRTSAAGFVYSISRVSTTLIILFIAFFIGAKNAFGIFSFAWVMIIICGMMLLFIGKTSTGRQVEDIAN
jgi:putative MFS transporter